MIVYVLGMSGMQLHDRLFRFEKHILYDAHLLPSRAALLILWGYTDVFPTSVGRRNNKKRFAIHIDLECSAFGISQVPS